MRVRGHPRIIVVISVAILVGQALVLGAPSVRSNYDEADYANQSQNSADTGDSSHQFRSPYDSRRFLLADDPVTGIINPVLVEQSGYIATGTVGARTDTRENLVSNLTIDEANSWIGSVAEVDVSNLERLYVANGSFNDGFPGQNINPNKTSSASYYPLGWNTTSVTTDVDQTQISSYDDSGSKFVVVENQGEKIGASGKRYRHYAGTKVLWYQNASNVPYVEDFSLSFRYLYLRGPRGSAAPGNCSITVSVNGTAIWNQSLVALDDRGVWYSTGEIPINVASPGSIFNFSIGLVIDQELDIHADDDYDGDGFNDGVANVLYITSYIDDVHFTGANPPGFDEVDFEFRANTDTVSVQGVSGQGYASVANQSYWKTSPLSVELSSNVSVSFDYTARLLSHRFANSSWTNDVNKQGVSYSADPGASANLALFTYVGTLGEYEDFNVTITHPWDWDNARVFNPFLDNSTDDCEISIGSIRIPTPILMGQGSLGWWEVTIESPNYAESISPQLLNVGSWVDSSVFRSTNITRVSAEIGTPTTTPDLGDPVNVTWSLPNGTLWSEESITTGSNGFANSTSHELGPANTSAGLWRVHVQWTNGSEIAYGSTTFGMYHSASLTPANAIIETEFGPTITNFLYYVDTDTGQNIMNESATIEGNWTGSDVTFAPNLIKNWWEGDFDTSLAWGGEFVVVVNASLPFYEDASCQFIVNVTYTTVFDLPLASGLPLSRGLNESVDVNLSYKYSNGTGISSADIDVSYSGPENGLNVSSWTESPIGNYTFEIQGKKKGTYSVVVTASKAYHEKGLDSFTIEVEQVGTEIHTFNGTADQIQYGEDYRFTVQYNSTAGGVLGASLEVFQVTPQASGFAWGSNVSEGNGLYSMVFSPTNTSSFTVVLRVSRADYETQFTTFYLTVIEIPTLLSLNETSASIGITDQYTITMMLTSGGSGVAGATISVVNPSEDLDFPDWQDEGGGNYTLTIDPHLSGTYLVTVQATLPFHQIGVDSFTLVVEETPTVLILWNGTSGFIHYGDDYRLVVRYAASNGTGLTAAHVNVTIDPETGLSYGNALDEGFGNFSFVFMPSETTTFTITIEANLTHHRTQFATFTLTVAEITTLLSLNVSSETISIEETLAVSVTFIDHDGLGIAGARISFIEADESLSFENITDLLDGNYTFIVDPSLFGSYLIRIRANKTNYLDGFDSFSLVVSVTETELYLLNGTADSIQFRENYTLAVCYENVWGVGLPGALIEISSVVPVFGMSNESTIDHLNGNYSIRLIPLAAGTFTVTIRAWLLNQQTQFRTFTLTVNSIPTILSLNESTTEIAIDQSFALALFFSEEGGSGIENATIDVIELPSELDVADLSEIGGGWYVLTIEPNQIGSHSFFIRASQANYLNQTTSFTLLATLIPTSLDSDGGVQEATVRYLERFDLVLFYLRTDSNGSVTDAAAEIVSNPEVGLHFLVLENDGNVTIEIWTDSIGIWTLSIVVSKSDHDSSQFAFTLEVVRIPLEIEVLHTLSGLENTLLPVQIRLTERGTENAVSGALVRYTLYANNEAIESERFVEGQNGIYETLIPLPEYSADTNLTLEIRVDIENYVLDDDSVFNVFNLNDSLGDFLDIAVPGTSGLGVVVSLVVTQRLYTRRRRKQIIEALEIKRRFEDAQSLLGVVVLHKTSGLPLYSKILKGGFDESMVSAFITAITQFRTEFAMEMEHDEFMVTQISDIIRAVPTMNLLCSFITVTRPSEALEKKMVIYAKSVSFVFDSVYEMAPLQKLEQDKSDIFDAIFDDALDGALIRPHRITIEDDFPKGLRCIQWMAPKVLKEDGSFALDELAGSMADCGIEEGEVYLKIQDAIERGLLETTEPVESVDTSKFVDVESDGEPEDTENL
ncbi:MAG: hypothetical protein ACW99U_05120 [Candidatus Thorarchaeota archaeon]